MQGLLVLTIKDTDPRTCVKRYNNDLIPLQLVEHLKQINESDSHSD